MYTVLVISGHPDDMEIACAGTLLQCKECGDRVVVCHLSSGNQGHEIIMPDKLTEMRAKEAKESGELAGFEAILGEGLMISRSMITRSPGIRWFA